MVERNELVHYMSTILESYEFKDYCPNGLQVEGKESVQKIITGVSACQELFDIAVEQNADMIITHHGLFWDGQPVSVVGRRRDRLAALIKNDISLVSYHLPLDAHLEIGNNAYLGNIFSLESRRAFAEYGGRYIGVIGELQNEMSPEEFFNIVKREINSEASIIASGPDKIKSVAICSGGAPDHINEAVSKAADVYLTGESVEWAFHTAREEGIHFIAAGHHATEKGGIISLGNRIADNFGLDVKFVDTHNPF